MSVLADITRNVLVIIILASFLELLLPGGAIRPFVRFAIGLFILIAVLNPVLGFFFDGRDLQVSWWDWRIEVEEEEFIAERGRQINENMISQNNQTLKEKVEGQVKAVVLLVPGVKEVDTEAEIRQGMLESICFNIYPEDMQSSEAEGEMSVFIETSGNNTEQRKQQIEDKILQVISNMYGLGAEKIDIKFEGGG